MLNQLQRIGKSLMLPIAVLPAAALLLRLGVLFGSDLGWGEGTAIGVFFTLMTGAGGVVFDNLPLLFAVGVAVGLTEGSGVAALTAVVGYQILAKLNGLGSLWDVLNKVEAPAKVNMSVFGGIAIGFVAAWAFNKYKDVRLPSYLGFFAGRRFVPIVGSFFALLVGLVAGFVWPPIGAVLEDFGTWIVGAGFIGLLLYGLANRLLLLIGLHHILNTYVWFVAGTFVAADGTEVHGDLSRFFAGDPSAGIFMAGWFAVMMFGLPAAAYAIYRASDASEKTSTGSIMASAGFTSFLTGITEPIEFSFAYAAPVLFAIHGLLAGVALGICAQFDWMSGFGFSAGLIDYLLNYNLAAEASSSSSGPLLVLVLGVVWAFLYYTLFAWAIKTYDLATPGRSPKTSSVA
ncbi:MAG: PTS transporter subunit EIIC [Actinomycetota bacterium]